MGNSWLRRAMNGNVSASGCGEPIPPSTSLPLGGVAQYDLERSLVRREAAGSSPVVPASSWWPWCKRQHPGL
jgi:hypothetical protein